MRWMAHLLMVLMLIILAGCGSGAEKVIRLQEPTGKQAEPRNKSSGELPFRVAVSSILSPVETLDSYEPLLKYLEIRLKRPVVLLQRRTYQEVNQLLIERGVDLAFVCSGGYTAGRDMELLATPQVQGRHTYQSYIIVGKSLPGRTLRDLQGSSFAYTDPLSFSGHIAPLFMLLSEKADPKTHFGRTFFTFSHDNSIRSVAEGIVDGAAVDSMIFDRVIAKHPDWKSRVKIIEKSVSVGNPPVVVPQGLDPELREKILALLLGMHLDSPGKEALGRLDFDRFILPEDGWYQPIAPMWQAVRGLM